MLNSVTNGGPEDIKDQLTLYIATILELSQIQ